MTTYGYIRVSTEKQSYQHMEYEISEYAAKNKIKIDEWIEEDNLKLCAKFYNHRSKFLNRVRQRQFPQTEGTWYGISI